MSRMFDKLLVAVDGSQGAQEALKLGVEMQKICGAELLILSVYREHNLWKASVTFVYPEKTASTDDAMRQYAQEVAEKSKAYAIEQGVESVRSFYIGGGPARNIVKFSKDHDINLIIMGKKGLSESTHDLLGGVSHKVTSLAECPVLTV
jgi:nucleotide-binding universal stress UspA family protein